MKSTASNHTVLTPNALYILKKRYLDRNSRGRVVETPDELFRRVASVVARAELKYGGPAAAERWGEVFYDVMARLEFLPNSPTLLNAGRLSGQLSSCFVLPVGEASSSQSIEKARLVHVSGGGTGFNLSRLAPKTLQSSGPVSLLTPLSDATASVKQGGIRRGCNIAMLDVRHPDILEFIRAKDTYGVLSNFYLSVSVTTAFMEAVKEGRDYDLIDPVNGETIRSLSAREVFDGIVTQTWKTGDPGLVFIDRIYAANPVPALGEIEGVSGCGEQLLLPYESCNLGSVNLARMLTADESDIDYVKLARTVKLATRFLDDVIDVNTFPLPEIAAATLKTRKIGLGVMGFADMLATLGFPYPSDEAIALADKIMGFINDEAHRASAALGAEKGVFPAFEGSIYDIPGGPSMRNASCTTIAPTGTISLIAGCSNGIEPFFALVYMRRIMGGKSLLEVNREFILKAKERGFYSPAVFEQMAMGAKLNEMDDIPEDVKPLFSTASEIGADWHVHIQAAFQRHVDNAVSKTVNLPHTATLEDVAKTYMLAYANGLKGITVYRDGSRRKQPLEGRINAGLLDKYLEDS